MNISDITQERLEDMHLAGLSYLAANSGSIEYVYGDSYLAVKLADKTEDVRIIASGSDEIALLNRTKDIEKLGITLVIKSSEGARMLSAHNRRSMMEFR